MGKSDRKKPPPITTAEEEKYPSRSSTIRVVKILAVFYLLAFAAQIVELLTLFNSVSRSWWFYWLLVFLACLCPLAAFAIWFRSAVGRAFCLVLSTVQLLVRAFFIPMTELFNAFVLLIMLGAILILFSDGVDRVFGKGKGAVEGVKEIAEKTKKDRLKKR
jgi:hypothetical protein